MSGKRVHLIFTGGTIAMSTDAQGRLVPANSGEALLRAIPDAPADCILSTQQLCNVASAHLTESLWLQLRQAIVHACAEADVCGVVVVQGTDTLEETAFFLDASLSDAALQNKPIVLTGAMRSADEPNGDGPSNLSNAIWIAREPTARGRGAMVAMSGRIHAARHVRKNHSTQTDAFDSRAALPLGEVVREQDAVRVQFAANPQRMIPMVDAFTSWHSAFQQDEMGLPRVDIVSTHIVSDALFIRHSIANGAAAIVIQALGAGNVNPAISDAIAQALAQGIAIVIASRVPLGNTEPIYGYVGGGQSLVQLGAVMSHDLPAHKARIFAQLLLAQTGSSQSPLTIVRNGFARLSTINV